MKKLISIILIISLMAIMSINCYSQSNNVLQEDSTIKVIIDGKYRKFLSNPILSNKKTYFPLFETLTFLGFQNDNKHIIWNSSKKSITIIKDKLTITLNTNSLKAIVNGKTVSIDTAPVIYKNKPYIPLEFIVKKLNKKMSMDSATNSIIISNIKDFDLTKGIIEKTNKVMKEVKRYKFSSVRETLIDERNRTENVKREVDCEKKVNYLSVDYGFFTTEDWFIGEYSYFRQLNGDTWSKWSKSSLSNPEDHYKYSGLFNDSIGSGLITKENASHNEYVIEGDIIVRSFPYSLKLKNLSIVHTKVIIDKKTFYIKSIISNTVEQDQTVKFQYSFKSTINYHDMNGDFEIMVPSDLEL